MTDDPYEIDPATADFDYRFEEIDGTIGRTYFVRARPDGDWLPLGVFAGATLDALWARISATPGMVLTVPESVHQRVLERLKRERPLATKG